MGHSERVQMPTPAFATALNQGGLCMKKLLFPIIVLVLFALTSLEANAVELRTYVSMSTFTPTGDGTFSWSFQNTSKDVRAQIERLAIFNCSSSAVTGGIVKMDTYGGGSYPANIVASTGPVSVVLENVGSLPVMPSSYINVDEAATTNLIATYDFASNRTQAITLPSNGTRAIVLKQTQVGSTDFTVGCLGVKVTFTTQ